MSTKTNDQSGDSKTNGTGGQGGDSTGGNTGDTGDTKDGNGSKDGQAKGEGDEDTLDESALDPKTKAYITKLRKENAGHRTRANTTKNEFDAFKQKVSKAVGNEDDEVPAEKRVEELSSQAQSLAMENAILSMAVENNVPKDGLKYFKFLVAQAAEELAEGEELSEEAMVEILADVRGKFAPASTTTSVTTKKAGNPDGSTEVTLDKFCKMSIGEKSALYTKNPELYTSLMEQAKETKRLV